MTLSVMFAHRIRPLIAFVARVVLARPPFRFTGVFLSPMSPKVTPSVDAIEFRRAIGALELA
jgi:hypothetical protein